MALPKEVKPINISDYENDKNIRSSLDMLLEQAGMDKEDREVFNLYMFAKEHPSDEAVTELANKYGTTPEVVQKHAQGLYDKVIKHPYMQRLIPR